MTPPTPHPILSRTCRPLILGAGIGHPSGWGGTLGGFVRLTDGRRGLVSTAFSIAPPGAARGDRIHQPGIADQPTLTGSSRIAELADVAAAVPEAPGMHDVAAAALLDRVEALGNVVPPGFPHAGLRLHVGAPPEFGDAVAMLGRTSGFRTGVVTALEVDNFTLLAHAPRRKAATYVFNGLIEVTGDDGPFSVVGDGGALVWRQQDGAALGLIVGGDDVRVSLVMPLGPCLRIIGAVWEDPPG